MPHAEAGLHVFLMTPRPDCDEWSTEAQLTSPDPSNVSEEEGAEWLALELLKHLPQDQAGRLLRGLSLAHNRSTTPRSKPGDDRRAVCSTPSLPSESTETSLLTDQVTISTKSVPVPELQLPKADQMSEALGCPVSASAASLPSAVVVKLQVGPLLRSLHVASVAFSEVECVVRECLVEADRQDRQVLVLCGDPHSANLEVHELSEEAWQVALGMGSKPGATGTDRLPVVRMRTSGPMVQLRLDSRSRM